jgi:hypothetical protein
VFELNGRAIRPLQMKVSVFLRRLHFLNQSNFLIIASPQFLLGFKVSDLHCAFITKEQTLRSNELLEKPLIEFAEADEINDNNSIEASSCRRALARPDHHSYEH